MIVVDSDNYEASGIEAFFFPGGEPYAKVPEFRENLLFFLKLRTWNDVGLAMSILSALFEGDKHTGYFFDQKVKLFIPYFPGARQDKPTVGTPMTLSIMAGLLNAADSYELHLFDIHSSIAANFLRRNLCVSVKNWLPSDLVNNWFGLNGISGGVIAPDTGALMRASQFKRAFYPSHDIDLIECSKVRDPVTGRLSDYSLGRIRNKGTYLVVDDICDGGGTFNLLAEAFDRDPIGKQSSLRLYVSHGIFSRGIDAVSLRYESIITTDSWCNPIDTQPHPRLTVIHLDQLFPKIMEYSDV